MSAESTRADPDRPRVVLVGLGPTTATALRGLIERTEVVAVIRDGADDTTALAVELGVQVHDDTSVAGVASCIADLAPDAVVVSSYNRILSPDTIGDRPAINVHYAPLPRGRGRAPVNWAIINGEENVSISIHHLVPELDAGGVLFRQDVPIREDSTAATLYDELNSIQSDHIAEAVVRAVSGDPGRTQDESAASYFCTRVPDDGEIDWSASTTQLDRLIRALVEPFPGAFTWLGLERLYVDAATPLVEPRRYEGRVPGRIVAIDRAEGHVDVLTGDGVLRVTRVRLGDDEPVAAARVIKSVSVRLGLSATALVDAVTSLRR